MLRKIAKFQPYDRELEVMLYELRRATPLKIRQKFKSDNFPIHFYKYYSDQTNIEWIEDQLINSFIHLSTPKNFNDVYDMRPHISLDCSRDELRKRLKNIAKNIHPELNKKQLDLRTSELMVNEKLTTELVTDIFHNRLNQSGVFCLTTSPRNEALWGLYANSNKGFAIQYSAYEQPGIFLEAHKVNYSENRPSYNWVKSDSDSLISALVTKSKKWEAEEEWRIIRIFSADTSLSIYPKVIKSIFFGSDASECFIEKIHNILIKRERLFREKIKTYKAFQNSRTYRMRFRRIL
jgi:hypothetical protein